MTLDKNIDPEKVAKALQQCRDNWLGDGTNGRSDDEVDLLVDALYGAVEQWLEEHSAPTMSDEATPLDTVSEADYHEYRKRESAMMLAVDIHKTQSTPAVTEKILHDAEKILGFLDTGQA